MGFSKKVKILCNTKICVYNRYGLKLNKEGINKLWMKKVII